MKTSERKWYQIDATNMTLGKVAVEAANILRGKNKPTFTPHLDGGDYVIVTNAEKIKLTGNKLEGKKYYKHTGYIGHLRVTTAKDLMSSKPERIIELAVKGMIPRNKLKKEVVNRLKVFIGEDHEHTAQQPKQVTVKY